MDMQKVREYRRRRTAEKSIKNMLISKGASLNDLIDLSMPMALDMAKMQSKHRRGIDRIEKPRRGQRG